MGRRGHPDEVELLANAPLADNVDLLARLLELDLLHVCSGSEGGRKDLLGLDVEAERVELRLVALRSGQVHHVVTSSRQKGGGGRAMGKGGDEGGKGEGGGREMEGRGKMEMERQEEERKGI